MVCTANAGSCTDQNNSADGDENTSSFDEVWEDYFAQRAVDHPRRSVPWWARVLGATLAFAVLVSAVTAAVQSIRYLTRISEPEAIVEYAEGYVERAPLGFLVTAIDVEAIDAPDVGAYVRANPADGVVTIDIRPWEDPGLDRIMAHEIGHLIDFALYETLDDARKADPSTVRRGGLDSEVWAECAAVAAGTRNIDDSSHNKEYRCTEEELTVFESVMRTVDELCVPWRPGTPCWSVPQS